MSLASELLKKAFWGNIEKNRGKAMVEAMKQFGKKVISKETPAVEPALTEVFTKGVENYSNEELDSVMKNAMIKVFRYDRYAKDLMNKGLQKDLMKNPPLADEQLERYILNKSGIEPTELHSMIRTGKFTSEVADLMEDWGKYKQASPFDEKGLYWSWGKPDAAGIPPYQSQSESDLITGVLNPKATPGIDVKFRGGEEVIQKEPGNILAKYGDIFKIIGLGGGTTLGSQLIPGDEAEAGSIPGILGKVAAKEVEKVAQSSAAKRLIGKVWSGKTIKDVVKGTGSWRHIMFEDGTQQPVNGSKAMSDIVKELRTQEYMDKLKNQPDEGSKLLQATKSLQHHLSRQQPLVNKELKEEWRRKYSNLMKAGETNEVPWTWIESHQIYLPEEYAKILEDAGAISIKGK